MPRVAALLSLLLLASCSRGAEPVASQAAPPPAAPPAPGPAASAPGAALPAPDPDAPVELPVTSAFAVAGDEVQPLARDAATTVDPAAAFTVEVPVALLDARLSLLDRAGAMVPASGGAEIAAAAARFTLAPDAPLAAGEDYALRLDGAVAQTARDREGRAYGPASWTVRVTAAAPAGRDPPRR